MFSQLKLSINLTNIDLAPPIVPVSVPLRSFNSHGRESTNLQNQGDRFHSSEVLILTSR